MRGYSHPRAFRRRFFACCRPRTLLFWRRLFEADKDDSELADWVEVEHSDEEENDDEDDDADDDDADDESDDDSDDDTVLAPEELDIEPDSELDRAYRLRAFREECSFFLTKLSPAGLAAKPATATATDAFSRLR